MSRRLFSQVLFFCGLIFSIPVSAQSWIWAKEASPTWNGKSSGIATDISGNVYVTGYFDTPIFSMGTLTVTNANTSMSTFDVFLAKYDAFGNVLWLQKASGAVDDFSTAVAVDQVGNVYITGYFESPTITFGSFTLTNSNSNNSSKEYFIVKYDPNGNVIWAQSVGGMFDEYGTSITTDVSGYIYVGGCFYSPTITFGTTTLASVPNSTDAFLVKYDAAGNVIWAKSAGGANSDEILSVTTDPSGNVYTSGRFSSPTLVFGTTTLTNLTTSYYDLFIVKYDALGNALWAKSYGGTLEDHGCSVATDATGNVFLCGKSNSPSITFGTTTLFSFGNNTIPFLIKYDSSGNILWVRTSNGVFPMIDDSHIEIATDLGGNVYMTGDFYSDSIIFNPDTLYGSHASGYFPGHLYLVKYDPSGNVICGTALYGGGLYESLATDFFGNVYLHCTSGTNILPIGTDTLTNGGIFVAKYSCGCNSFTGNSGTFSICTSNSITLSAPPGTSYLWSTGDTTNSITVSPASSTVYSVIVSSWPCIDTLYKTVNIDTVAITGINVISNVLCNGTQTGSANIIASGNSSLTYQWSPTGGTNATGIGLGVGTFTCTVTDSLGCSSSSTVAITQPSPVSVSPSTTPVICTSQGTASVSASGGTGTFSYLWNPTGQTTQTITGAAGTYTATVTDSNGCITYQMITISQNDSILLASTASTLSSCSVSNGTATATISGGALPYTYNWSPSGGNSSVATGLSAGTYTVTATDVNGCITTQTVIVGNPPPPVISIGNDTTIFFGGTAFLSAYGGVNYNWTPTTNLSCTNCPNPVASPPETTLYCVTVADTNGCITTACEKVIIKDDCPIFIPTAFSPNDDGANDFLCVMGNCMQNFHFTVYDRWGEKVFETNDKNICWDGTFHGEKLNTAVFAYTIEAVLFNGTKVSKSGNINLVR